MRWFGDLGVGNLATHLSVIRGGGWVEVCGKLADHQKRTTQRDARIFLLLIVIRVLIVVSQSINST